MEGAGEGRHVVHDRQLADDERQPRRWRYRARQNANKFSFDAAMNYGTSNILASQVMPDPNDPTGMTLLVTGIERRQVTSTNNWVTKARYDRFFTTNNAGYASALAAADRIAGKSFAGGGQVGYSRQLIKNDVHLLVQRDRLRLLRRALPAAADAHASTRSASTPPAFSSERR